MAEAECVVCDEVITQPLCAPCVTDEMEVWLQEVRPDLVDEMKTVASEMWISRGEMSCILCKDNMDVCTYCFTLHILNWLQDKPELVPRFLQYFNFDLHYQGYAKELLALV